MWLPRVKRVKGGCLVGRVPEIVSRHNLAALLAGLTASLAAPLIAALLAALMAILL